MNKGVCLWEKTPLLVVLYLSERGNSRFESLEDDVSAALFGVLLSTLVVRYSLEMVPSAD